MKNIFFAVVIFFAKVSFAQSELKFIQGNDTIPVTGERNIVQIERKPFTIQFLTKPYENKKKKNFATQVAVMQFLQKNPKVGDKISSIPFFEPGTGLAATDSGYNSTHIDSEGHHYLFYSNEKDRRVKLVNQGKEFLLVNWDVEQFFQNESEVAVASTDFGSLYFIFLRNDNFNEVIDEGELMVIKVEFLAPPLD